MSNKYKKTLNAIGYYTFTIIIGIMVMIPFFWMLSTSFKSRGALTAIPIEWIPKEPTAQSYVNIFTEFPFGRAIINSGVISVLYTLITLISASMAAFAFAKLQFRGRNLIFKCYLAALMIPAQVTLIPLFLIMNSLNLVNTYTSVLIPSIFRTFAIFMLVQQMKTIPNDFIHSAKIDGANNFMILRKIMIPLSAPTLATLAIITFMDAWNDYLWPLVMLTGTEKQTIPIALSRLSGQFKSDYTVLMAGSLISMIPIIIIYIIAQGKMKEGLSLGGIKG